MICHANMRVPKTPDAATNDKYFTQEVINKLIKSINETTGYHVVEVLSSETEDILKIQINTDVIDGTLFD